MKKFLKILLIIVGIVFLIFAALICIGLFVDYDDHIENGRYTYVPEDDNKDNALEISNAPTVYIRGKKYHDTTKC